MYRAVICVNNSEISLGTIGAKDDSLSIKTFPMPIGEQRFTIVVDAISDVELDVSVFTGTSPDLPEVQPLVGSVEIGRFAALCRPCEFVKKLRRKLLANK